jgi:signal transduction histidine kinase
MKKIITLCCVLLLIFSCKKEIENPKHSKSENRIQIEKWFNRANSSTNTPDSIVFYASKMEQAVIHEPNEYKAMAAFVKGIQLAGNSEYTLSTKQYDNGLQLLKHSSADTLDAKIYKGIGNNYKVTGDYSKSFQNLYKSLKIYEKYRDKSGICSINASLGEVYFQKDNVQAAKEHLTFALKILEDDKSNPAYLTAAHIFANVYGMTGDFDNALKIDEEGIKISNSIHNSKLKSSFLDNKANCYLFSNRLDSAYYYFNECLKIDIASGNKKQIADTYSNLGRMFLMEKEYAKAEQYIFKSIAMLKNVNGKPNLEKCYQILTDIYAEQGSFEKALTMQKKLIDNYNSMIDIKKEAAEAEFKILYETQKKESKIQLLKKEEKINSLKIKEQHFEIEKRNYLIAAFLIVLGSILIVWYLWKSKQKLRNKLKEDRIIQKTEEQERLRIAKDIHDDLGSGLSKISFLSEIILQKTADIPEVRTSSQSVKETSMKMIENMRDLIWALNPENTTIANLIARIREYTTDYLENFPIQLDYTIPNKLPQSPISKESHRQLFMVVKETLNNITKHANATEVSFTIILDNSVLLICIKDNGIGFENISNGNGLNNMKSRLNEIGGVFEVISKPEIGTSVTVIIPFNKILKAS